MKNISKIKVNTNKKMTEVIKNDGNLYVVSAKTGSGKTYSAGEVVANLVSKNRAEGRRERIIFTSGQKANLPISEMKRALHRYEIDVRVVISLTSKNDSLEKLEKAFFNNKGTYGIVEESVLSQIREKIISLGGSPTIVDDISRKIKETYENNKDKEINGSYVMDSIDELYFNSIFDIMRNSDMFLDAYSPEARVYLFSKYISEDLTKFFSDYFFEAADVVLMSHYKLISSSAVIIKVRDTKIDIYKKEYTSIENALIIVDESEQMIHSFNKYVLKLEKVASPDPDNTFKSVAAASTYSTPENWVDFKNIIDKGPLDPLARSVVGLYDVIKKNRSEKNWNVLSGLLSSFYGKINSIDELYGLSREEKLDKIYHSLTMEDVSVDQSVEVGFYSEKTDGSAKKTNARTHFMIKESNNLYVDGRLITKRKSDYKLDELIEISRKVNNAYDYLIRGLISLDDVKSDYPLTLYIIKNLYGVNMDVAKEIKSTLDSNSWKSRLKLGYCNIQTTIFEKIVESNEEEWFYKVESPKYYYIEDILGELIRHNTVVLMSATIKLNTSFEGFDFKYISNILNNKGKRIVDVMGVTPLDIITEVNKEKEASVKVIVIPSFRDTVKNMCNYIQSLTLDYPKDFSNEQSEKAQKFIKKILSKYDKLERQESGEINNSSGKKNNEDRVEDMFRSIANVFISLLVLSLEKVNSSLSLTNTNQSNDSVKTAIDEIKRILNVDIAPSVLCAETEKGEDSDSQEVKFTTRHRNGTITSIHTSMSNGSTGKNYMVDIEGEEYDVEALCMVKPSHLIETKIGMNSEEYHSNRKKNLKHAIKLGGGSSKVKEVAYRLEGSKSYINAKTINEPFMVEVARKYISMIEQSVGRLSRKGNGDRKVIVVTKDVIPWSDSSGVTVDIRNNYYNNVIKDIKYKGLDGLSPHELSYEVIMINRKIEEYMIKEKTEFMEDSFSQLFITNPFEDENKESKLISDTISEAAKGNRSNFSKKMKELIKDGPSEFKLKKKISGEIVYDKIFRMLPLCYWSEFAKAYVSTKTDKYIKHDSKNDFWRFVGPEVEGSIKYDWDYVSNHNVVLLYNRLIEIGVVKDEKISPCLDSSILHPGIFHAMYIPKLSESIVYHILGDYLDKMPDGIHFELFDLYREDDNGCVWVDVKVINSYSDDVLRSSNSMHSVEAKLESVNTLKNSGIAHFINLFNTDDKKTTEVMSEIKSDIYSTVLFDLSEGQKIEDITVSQIDKISNRIKNKTKEVLDERSKNK